MVHHIGLYKLKPGITPEETEEMMMRARMQLLKIDEVLSIKCGRRINPNPDAVGFYATRKVGTTREPRKRPAYRGFNLSRRSVTLQFQVSED